MEANFNIKPLDGKLKKEIDRAMELRHKQKSMLFKALSSGLQDKEPATFKNNLR